MPTTQERKWKPNEPSTAEAREQRLKARPSARFNSLRNTRTVNQKQEPSGNTLLAQRYPLSGNTYFWRTGPAGPCDAIQSARQRPAAPSKAHRAGQNGARQGLLFILHFRTFGGMGFFAQFQFRADFSTRIEEFDNPLILVRADVGLAQIVESFPGLLDNS